MATTKTLQTRIALKYASYADWTNENIEGQGANLVLLKGELGICEITATNEQTKDTGIIPTVLFKVGNGTSPFKSLPWASAKAADVYNWAKASDIVLEGKTLKFVGTDKTVPINYATPEEVKALTDSLDARLSAVESKLGEAGVITNTLADHESRLDTIEGEGEGSIKKTLSDAKSYTDTREVEIKKYADQAEADAISAAEKASEAKVAVERSRINSLEAADANQASLISSNTAAINKEISDRETAISDLDTAYKAADLAINNKIGTKDDTVEVDTVYGAIAVAKKSGDDAAEAVNNLSKGQVATNTAEIAKISANLATEISNREAADKALSDRLDSIDAFFEAADHDGEDGGLTDALDTLKEIQAYLNGEGGAAGGLIDRIAANEEAIDDLNDIVKDGGTLEVRVDALEGEVSAVKSRTSTLETRADNVDKTLSGYTTEGSVAAAVKEAKDLAAEGVSKAESAQGDVDDLKAVVEDETNGLQKTYALATEASAGVASLSSRMATAEGEIDALQDIVSGSGGNSNAQLRADITELQGIVKTGADANATLGGEIDNLAATVNDETTGLAATKAIADKNKTDIATNTSDISAIKADYIRSTDMLIFDCGSATEVI